MPVKRDIFRDGFRFDSLHLWICPRCGRGRLKLEEGTLHEAETAGSREHRNDPEWEPDWYKRAFVALLTCDNSTCREVASMSGYSIPDQDYDPSEGQPVWSDCYHTTHFSPSPQFIDVPVHTPEEIKTELSSAFVLFWTDKPACINRIRTVVEMVLDHLKIPRWTPEEKPEERHPLFAGQRIELLERNAEYVKLAKLLRAVKWIGNAGSHNEETKLTVDDVFDAFDLLEQVLDAVFDPHTQSLEKLATMINERKRPLGKDRFTVKLKR
jgi:hypothetical protein